MSRARFTTVGLSAVGVALGMLGMTWACIPHPSDDFDDYKKRVEGMPKTVIEASTFEAAPPPTNAVDGLYYGACVSELAFGQVSKAFNFYTRTKFVPGEAGGMLELSIEPLAVENNQPPAKVEASGIVGSAIAAPPGAVAANGRFRLELGTVQVPGKANPISGSDVEISGTTLEGRFASERFCGRLGGNVLRPAAAARTLDPPSNICQFVPVKDGDATPKLAPADFQPESCPLD